MSITTRVAKDIAFLWQVDSVGITCGCGQTDIVITDEAVECRCGRRFMLDWDVVEEVEDAFGRCLGCGFHPDDGELAMHSYDCRFG